MKDGLSIDVKRRLEEATAYTEIHVFAFPGKPVRVTYIFEGKIVYQRTLPFEFPTDGVTGSNIQIKGMRGSIPVKDDPNYRPSQDVD